MFELRWVAAAFSYYVVAGLRNLRPLRSTLSRASAASDVYERAALAGSAYAANARTFAPLAVSLGSEQPFVASPANIRFQSDWTGKYRAYRSFPTLNFS